MRQRRSRRDRRTRMVDAVQPRRVADHDLMELNTTSDHGFGHFNLLSSLSLWPAQKEFVERGGVIALFARGRKDGVIDGPIKCGLSFRWTFAFFGCRSIGLCLA